MKHLELHEIFHLLLQKKRHPHFDECAFCREQYRLAEDLNNFDSSNPNSINPEPPHAPETQHAGTHFLCAERKRLGLPTPNLGVMCPDCQGSGYLGRSSFGTFFFLNDTSNIFHPMTSTFVECSRCHGEGIIPEESILEHDHEPTI